MTAFLLFVASVIGVVLALLLVLVFIVSPLVIACRKAWSLYRSSRRTIVKHDRFGEIEVYDDDAQAKITLGGRELRVELPASGGAPSPDALETLVRLSCEYEPLECTIGLKAIEEWKDISDSYDSDEDRETVECLKPLMSDPRLFLRTFTLQGLEIDGPIREARIEYLTPWDPEHTRCAVFDWSLELKRYGLSCGM